MTAKRPLDDSRRSLLAAFAASLLVGAPLAAADAVGSEEDPLAQFMWVARPIVIFANSDRDPRLLHQLREIDRVLADLEERDAVIVVDTEPGPTRFETTALRRKFRPHDFNLILIGKDGEVKKRSPAPVSGSQLTRMIDRLPLRQQEIGRR